ncbi:hypothetical protein CR513_05323, partial [Mucuna pruriens]
MNVIVKVDKLIFLADFVVLNMHEDSKKEELKKEVVKWEDHSRAQVITSHLKYYVCMEINWMNGDEVQMQLQFIRLHQPTSKYSAIHRTIARSHYKIPSNSQSKIKQNKINGAGDSTLVTLTRAGVHRDHPKLQRAFPLLVSNGASFGL